MLASKSFLFLLPPVLIIISAYYYAGTKTLEDDKNVLKSLRIMKLYQGGFLA